MRVLKEFLKKKIMASSPLKGKNVEILDIFGA